MPLSPAAIEHDKNCGAPLIPLEKIHVQNDWNSRGYITAADVIELVPDVAARGLIEPVILRRLWDTEKPLKDKGKEFFLIGGFRRLLAYRANDAVVIPAMIRACTNEFDARDINAVENLQRVDLNILQEARSIKHYWEAGWGRQEIANRINKSMGWVQIRCMLLEMPEQIQKAAANDYLKQTDIRDLYQHRGNSNEMLRIAGLLVDKRKAGETGKVREAQKPDKKHTKKQRTVNEMLYVMDRIREHCALINKNIETVAGDWISDQGNSIITRIIGWGCGEVTTGELEDELKHFFRSYDVIYNPMLLEPVS